MMGCFSTPKSEKRPSSVPRSSQLRRSVSSRDFVSLLSNKPVELPDPRSLIHQASTSEEPTPNANRGVANELTPLADHASRALLLGRAGGERAAFSGPLVGGTAYQSALMSRASATSSYMSGDEGKQSCGLSHLRRATSFGGRPQPLPLPAAEDRDRDAPQKPLQLVPYLPLPASEDARATPAAPATTRTLSSRTRAFKLEDSPGSWTSRRGRVAPVGGLPLPPPSVASKWLPGLTAYEFSDLMIATDDFAPNCCLAKSASGSVYSARLKDSTAENDAKTEMAVLRLHENASKGSMEWKSEVQLLAQLSNANICAVKGYCTHESGPRLSTRERRRERLLVFEQPSNGSVYDHLFGSRCTTYLDWASRVDIALGTARGLLYLHDRAPRQIVYKEFKASNVLLDKENAPKLAGYGLSVTVSPGNKNSSFTTSMMLSQAHAKNNVRSFGIFLLEILTCKNSRDAVYFGDDNNFVQWGRQFMKDESKLSHMIDPRMKEGCPIKGATDVVSLFLQCVNKKEVLRPTMSEVVGALKIIKAKWCSNAKGSGIWDPSPGKPGRQSQDSHNFKDMQTSSDASSSENEDVSMSKLAITAYN